MTDLLNLLQYAVAASFVLLGLATLFQWLRQREQSRGYLALALGGLGVVALLGQIQTLSGYRFTLIQDLEVIIFLLTGYAVLLFRGTFVPLSRRANVLALAANVLIAVVLLLSGLPSTPTAQLTAFQSLVTIGLVVVWSVCVGEPILRFWLASQGRPRVQRSRLRALSLGFAGIVAILIVSVGAGSAVRNVSLQIAIQLVALLTVPLLYASFSPPTWLRRTWREKEEDQYRNAVQQLLLFAPDRETLANRATEWATRLVGADAALIADGDGTVLARRGIGEAQAERLVERLRQEPGSRLLHLRDASPASMIAVNLPMTAGPGRLITISGAFTPVFGTDEVSRLEDYATAVTAALDRSILTERLAALERTKTQFLNLASHELRGPVTVLRGYLSMLEKGTLSAAQLREIVPVLSAKTEEMNLMVDQMIEASRLEEGRVQLNSRLVDLRELATRSVAMMRPLTSAEHSISLHCPKTEVPVLVDPDRISTILTNLLDNALKYSPEGGEVRCHVARNGTIATISVTDKGIGIDPAHLGSLFTRFGRIVTSETSSIRGTGLGLYLARELARMHGGDITVDSKPGRGSTFVMAVPLAA